MDIPVFIVQNTIAKTVHSADIQRLHSDRINMNIAEHIPCKIAAQANTTAVNHTLRCILGQEIAVDKEKYCISQDHQFQLVPHCRINVLEDSLCRHIFHVHQFPTAVSVNSAGITAHRSKLTGNRRIIANANAGEIVLFHICKLYFCLSTVTAPFVVAKTGERQRRATEPPVCWHDLRRDLLTDRISVLCLHQLERTALIGHIPRSAPTNCNFFLAVIQVVMIGER